jgi:esterase/lipase superfamily enzyme
LETETGILDEVIDKQALRQKAEYSRLHEQVADVRKIRDELESSRIECVRKLTRVEQVLGVKSDYI